MKRRWLISGVIVLGLGVVLFYYWSATPKKEIPFSQKEIETALKERAQARASQKYYSTLLPIYEKILEKDPANKEAKKVLEDIKRALESFQNSKAQE